MRVIVRKHELVVRISVVPLVAGEKVVMRLLSRHTREFNLNELGMNEDDLSLVKESFYPAIWYDSVHRADGIWQDDYHLYHR